MQSIKDILNRNHPLSSRLKQLGEWQQLIAAWPTLVPEGWEQRCIPLKISGRRLILQVESSVDVADLSFTKSILEKKLCKFSKGKLSIVSFKIAANH